MKNQEIFARACWTWLHSRERKAVLGETKSSDRQYLVGAKDEKFWDFAQQIKKQLTRKELEDLKLLADV